MYYNIGIMINWADKTARLFLRQKMFQYRYIDNDVFHTVQYILGGGDIG